MSRGTYKRCAAYGCRRKVTNEYGYCDEHLFEWAHNQLQVSPRFVDAMSILMRLIADQAIAAHAAENHASTD